MKRAFSILCAICFIAALSVSACVPQPVATQPFAPTSPEPAKTEAPAVGKETTALVGFTASQTGKLNVESTRQINGLNLWIKQVNASGGIKLSDGTVVKFEVKFYDDESNKDRVQELYTRLATNDKADFLISPYSSGLADAAAVIAEQYEKVMITTGAASDSTYQKGYTLVYQAYTPASKYLTGSLDLLKSADTSAQKIAIVHENDKFSTDVATALKDYAEANNYQILLFEGYDSATTDFAPFINKIIEAGPDAIMGGGHFQDGTTFAKQLFEKKVAVKFISLLVAPPEPTFSELGEAALGIVGPSQWETGVKFTPESAKAEGFEWFGSTGEEFTSSYQSEFNEKPSYHAAGGYIAGLLLQKAIENAGTLETRKVASALDSLNLMTFFGHMQFDTTPDSHGLQIGHSMVYIQWVKSDGNLTTEIVWPVEGATATLKYPLR
jgi:branched-chain amino acid transport system substrate-binding protein